MIKISIVVPFFNEGASVDVLYRSLDSELKLLSNYDFEIIFVEDGSADDTLQRLISLHKHDRRIKIVELSRNFGKEAALTAGIDLSLGDAVILLDADLQDPAYLISDLLTAWSESNADVVLAKRGDRLSDSITKRFTANLYYTLHNSLSDVKIPPNVGDCRLMSRIVVDALKKLPERQRFMKGLFGWVGFKTISIEYVREKRCVGSSKFTGGRLWNFALEGITSFGTLPLRIWSYVGLLGAVIAALYGCFILLRTLIFGIDTPGYASVLIAIIFFGSLQLIGLGILGEYVGRIYMETKQRPKYLIRKLHQMG